MRYQIQINLPFGTNHRTAKRIEKELDRQFTPDSPGSVSSRPGSEVELVEVQEARGEETCR